MKFFPGQRIKKVRGNRANGAEAIFLGPAKDDDPAFDMLVTVLSPVHASADIFGLRMEIPAMPGETLLAISENWDPAIPPGMKSIEEEGELWEPEMEEITL